VVTQGDLVLHSSQPSKSCVLCAPAKWLSELAGIRNFCRFRTARRLGVKPAILHDEFMSRVMTLIEELREQLSGAPSNSMASMDEIADSFRLGRSDMNHFSQYETTAGGVLYEDRTNPDVQLELEAREIARQWIEARRHQGHLGN